MVRPSDGPQSEEFYAIESTELEFWRFLDLKSDFDLIIQTTFTAKISNLDGGGD